MHRSTILSLCFALLFSLSLTASEPAPTGVPADEVLKLLEEGNARFAAEKMNHPHTDHARLDQTATEGQHPVATILACSDSREPVELIFDQGVGDLFVLRVAGNVCDDALLDTVQYGVVSLGTRLCVVMGHTHCGAVDATCTHPDAAHVQHLVKAITPAVQRVQKETGESGKAIVERVVKENVYLQMEQMLTQSEFLRKAIREGNLTLVGAIYDIHTGKVEFLGQHPKNDELSKEPETAPVVEKYPVRNMWRPRSRMR